MKIAFQHSSWSELGFQQFKVQLKTQEQILPSAIWTTAIH